MKVVDEVFIWIYSVPSKKLDESLTGFIKFQVAMFLSVGLMGVFSIVCWAIKLQIGVAIFTIYLVVTVMMNALIIFSFDKNKIFTIEHSIGKNGARLKGLLLMLVSSGIFLLGFYLLLQERLI